VTSPTSPANDPAAIRAALLAVLGTLVALASLYAVSIALARSQAFAESPKLFAVGVTLDLTVTASLLVYLLGVRGGSLPRTIVFPVFFAGLLVARAILPPGHRDFASALAAGWFAIELALLGWLLVKLRSLVTHYHHRRHRGETAFEALESALVPTLGNRILARLLALELAIVYHATAGLFRRPPKRRAPDRDEALWGATLVAFGLLVLAEATAAHFLLRAWSPVAAFVAIALHLYTALWMIGDYRALRLSAGIHIEGDTLHIDLGLRARARIRLEHIEALEMTTDDPDPASLVADRAYVRTTILGKPNLLIHLAAPVLVRLSFGRRRRATVLGVALADPDALVAAASPGTPTARP
jgi:hypothetical protein